MGLSYFEYWQTTAGQSVTFRDKGGYWTAYSESTSYIITKHPAAIGTTNAYFESIGAYINHRR